MPEVQLVDISIGNVKAAEQEGENVNKADQQEEGNTNGGLHQQDGGNANEAPWQREAMLIVATLIITLTYQALANPSSTFLKEGSSKIDWECIYPNENKTSHGLIKSFEDCPAIMALLFLIFNTLIFLLSIVIVFTTLRGPNLLPVRWLTVLLSLCYGVLFTAFYPNAAYVASFFFAVALVMLYFSYFKEENSKLSNDAHI